MEQPGTYDLNGTDIRLSYDPASDTYKVTWHEVTRTNMTIDGAAGEAFALRDKLIQMGVRP